MTITHPEKVLFPDDGITKGELAAYYDAVADVMLPHLRGRPITMERFPAGIGAKGFLQKDVVKGFPAWLKRVEAPKKDGTVHYALANDRRSLQWLANQNTITMHVWPSRAPRLDRPDICVFDLDPSRDEPEVLRDAALALRDLLLEHGVTSWVKTSGSKGFHIVTRLAPRRDVRRLVELRRLGGGGPGAAQAEAADARVQQGGPRRPNLHRHRPQPAGRHVRRRLHGACATGRAGVGALHVGRSGTRRGAPATFTLRNMAARLADVGDLWAELVRPRTRAK